MPREVVALVSADDVVAAVRVHADRVHDLLRRSGCGAEEAVEVCESYALALIDALVRRNAIKASRVEAAFRAIPRHLFLPDVPLAEVYRNEAIPTKIVDGASTECATPAETLCLLYASPAYVAVNVRGPIVFSSSPQLVPTATVHDA